MAQLERAIKEQQAGLRSGGWRVLAKQLEEEFPEEFVDSKLGSNGASADPQHGVELPASKVVGSSPAVLSPPIAPGSSQTAYEALPDSFWRTVLYGSRDAMLPTQDANIAVRLVARELGLSSDLSLFTESVRVNTLRTTLDKRFGAAAAWRVMNELWRSAPASPGAPQPNGDQSHCSPGVLECPRSMPAWRLEFHQEVSNEQRLLESFGGWCG
jgi:hypothetical protein